MRKTEIEDKDPIYEKLPKKFRALLAGLDD